ncbi:MAG TPA: peptidoglycan-binding domain-containing protein [Candidatus Paceibacterota bacterium]
MFSSYKTTTKIKWLTIALMLVVVFVGSFNPVVALADETDVVVSDVVEVEPEVVAVEESAEVEDSLVDTQSAATEVGVELVKDSEIIKDNDPIVTEGEVILDNSVNEGVVVEELPEVATEPVVPDTSVTEEVVASSTPGVTVVDNTPVLSGDAVIESEVTPQDSHTVLEDISTEYGDNTNDSEIPSDIIEAISIEYSVVVNPGSGIGQEEVSLQYSFNTNNNPNPEVDEEISRQYSFITVSDIGHDEEISAQYSFTTEDDGNTDLDEEVSREYSFRTLPNIGHEEVSNEYSFTTDNGGGSNLDEEVSGEYSFRTQNGGNPDLDEEISAEYNFTTDNNGGGGCTSNCGGGGGGGGGRNRDRDRDDEVLPTQCLPLILEYIRFGRNNNPIEVLKLQWFLRTFEGFDVPLSGYYDRTTYEAVRIFQTRHADPILTSWGISEPTGFVFISTSLNINYIYCDIQGVQFDLRNFYKNVKPTYISMPKKGDGANYLLLPPPIQNNAGDEYMTLDVDLPKEIAVKNEGFLQVAMIGLLNFFGGIGDYFKNLWTGLTDWFKQIKDGNIVEALSLVRWWVWLLWIGFLMIVIGLVLIWKRLRDLKIENALLEESNQEMIEAEIELDNLEEVVEAETLADLVEEYNEHIAPEELETSHLEHISETLKDKVIELEEEVKNKK